MAVGELPGIGGSLGRLALGPPLGDCWAHGLGRRTVPGELELPLLHPVKSVKHHFCP